MRFGVFYPSLFNFFRMIFSIFRSLYSSFLTTFIALLQYTTTRICKLAYRQFLPALTTYLVLHNFTYCLTALLLTFLTANITHLFLISKQFRIFFYNFFSPPHFRNNYHPNYQRLTYIMLQTTITPKNLPTL